MDSDDREVKADAWRALAERLGVEEAALRAVAQVESAGSGFLPLPDDRPKILFEGHAFHRLTQGQFDAVAPNLSFPKWDRTKYAKTGAGEWARLNDACELDRTAALQSASWGAFQIMGFNFGVCAFPNVELFVADQKMGATEQLETFARFIARETFLSALKTKNWRAFAKAYNGPGFEQNKYDVKLQQAYDKFSKGTGTRAVAAKPAAADAHAVGRPSFGPTPAGRRRPAVRRPVKADPIDLRDWYYRPAISVVPPPILAPSNPPPIKNQLKSNACTGFSLATVIEYLLRRAERPAESISGYMLYSMARRYDEWAENDEKDEGSSLRGALKGWSRHGASAERLWKRAQMPDAPPDPSEDWWFDAVKRPMGAYYRLTPSALTDVQVALFEARAVYASALIHSGWDQQYVDAVEQRPVSVEEIPQIPFRPGEPGAGHAFAIVGYTDRGFIIQNSWGEKWGRRGLAILTYADWRLNAMDCWVVQLGVVTNEHREVARHNTLRVDEQAGGAVQISSNAGLATHEISAFAVDMERGGRLSTRGQFRTSEDDLKALLDFHLPAAVARWKVKKHEAIDVALYAHAGFMSEEDAAASARDWIPLLYSNRIFPIYLMWQANGETSIEGLVRRVLEGDASQMGVRKAEALESQMGEWKNQRIEGLARRTGGSLWSQMKTNADALTRTPASGVIKLFRLFNDPARRRKMPAVRLHLIGHSAGAVVQSFLGARALSARFTIETINLIAPAVSIDLFEEQLGAALVKKKIRLLLAHLTDTAERDDPTCLPYEHSLLYLASRAFEDHPETPILGMEKFLVPALVTRPWGAQVTRLASPGASLTRGDRLTAATTHRDLDDDRAVQDAVVTHIRKLASAAKVVRPRQGPSTS